MVTLSMVCLLNINWLIYDYRGSDKTYPVGENYQNIVSLYWKYYTHVLLFISRNTPGCHMWWKSFSPVTYINHDSFMFTTEIHCNIVKDNITNNKYT